MFERRSLLAAALAAALHPGLSAAEGDVASGRALAEERCASCHDISADGAFKLDPPSFAAIAVYRSEEQVFARLSLPATHIDMPRFGLLLGMDAIDDLVAYIASLERPVAGAGD